MKSARMASQDPIGWCALLALAFLALCCVRLTIPSIAYFDEVHYVPALREWIALDQLDKGAAFMARLAETLGKFPPTHPSPRLGGRGDERWGGQP